MLSLVEGLPCTDCSAYRGLGKFYDIKLILLTMKKYNLIPFLILLFLSPSLLFSQGKSVIEYLSGFKNTNHPQIAYWFLTPGYT